MSKINKKQAQNEEPFTLTKDEREKVKSLAAGIETGKNRALIVTCFLLIALFIGVLQSGQIVSKLETTQPNLLSDSVRVVAREWHEAMTRLGFVDVKSQMRKNVHTILPNAKGGINLIDIDLKEGGTATLRGGTQPIVFSEDQAVHPKEERTTTTFGWHRLRGSF